MRGAELLARWRVAREAAPAAVSPAVPGASHEAGTLENANKSGLSPLYPLVPASSDQGCNAERREAERERADGAAPEPEADDAGPGDAPEADDALPPEPEALPYRLPSWADPGDVPRPGDRCGCCGRHGSGGLWWIERAEPRGWRCSRCHPGDHMPEGERFEVQT
jgi:hypothetical protein